MLFPPDRVAFYIGAYPVMKYGVTMGLAISAALFLLCFFRKKHFNEFSNDTVLDLSFFVILGGIAGARLWYVLLNAEYYLNNLQEIMMVNHGGISIHGALVGGVLSGFFYVKKNKLNFLKLVDLYSLVIPVGQAVGRWGNFFNSEAFGKPCSLPWKMYIAPQHRPFEFQNFEYFHPTFLYESVADVIIFVILYFFLRKRFENRSGLLFFTYLILYSFVRIIIEYIRIDSVLNIASVPIAVIVSLVIILISFISIFVLLKSIYN